MPEPLPEEFARRRSRRAPDRRGAFGAVGCVRAGDRDRPTTSRWPRRARRARRARWSLALRADRRPRPARPRVVLAARRRPLRLDRRAGRAAIAADADAGRRRRGRRGIRRATGLPVHIKWPNDIVVADERRRAGGASSPASWPKARPERTGAVRGAGRRHQRAAGRLPAGARGAGHVDRARARPAGRRRPGPRRDPRRAERADGRARGRPREQVLDRWRSLAPSRVRRRRVERRRRRRSTASPPASTTRARCWSGPDAASSESLRAKWCGDEDCSGFAGSRVRDRANSEIGIRDSGFSDPGFWIGLRIRDSAIRDQRCC